MRRKQLVCWMAALAMLCCISQPGGAAPGGEGDRGKVVTYQGEVIAAYDNEILLLKRKVGYILVRTGERFYKLGIAPGDTILVSGKINKERVAKGSLIADTIDKVSASTQKRKSLRLRSVRDVLSEKKDGRVVVIRGEITNISPTDMTLKQGDASIKLRMGEKDGIGVVWSGRDVVVLGTVKRGPLGSSVVPIEIIPAVVFRREGEPEKAQSIQEILRQRPVGKLVKAQGRVAMFFGKEEGTILYEGENILIVRRAEKYLSLETQAGGLVHVVGVFGHETHRDKQYGVLKDARIDPADIKVTKPLNP